MSLTRVRIEKRMRDIYTVLRDKWLADAAGGIAVPELGKDAFTLAALRQMKQACKIELTERGDVRLTGQGLQEALLIERECEKKPAPDE